MKRLVVILILALFSMSLMAQTAIAPAAGDGSEGNPYEIASLENLYWIAASNAVVPDPDQETRWGFNYIQTANIDASETVDWFNGQGWHPIGDSYFEYWFIGSYNGAGYTIDNLYINRPDSSPIGLFGYISDSYLHRINILNANITAWDVAGVLVGVSDSSTIYRCNSSGILKITGNSGGGLVGVNTWHSTILKSSSSVSVTGGSAIGGIAGSNEQWAAIKMSKSSGNINASYGISGGLVGYNTSSNICCSYSSGKVYGDYHVGGLVGINTLSGQINDSYSLGHVMGNTNVGGLVGSQSASSSTNSYWNTQTSGQKTSAGGEGRTTAEMTYPYAENTYVNWDFTEIWEEDPVYLNHGYPFLHWQTLTYFSFPHGVVDPVPVCGSVNVPVNLAELGWSYFTHPMSANPLGFRVYMNSTGEFEEDDEFDWVLYLDDQIKYSSTEILPDLEYGTTYYWMVIPTTIYSYDDRISTNGKDRYLLTTQNSQLNNLGDAQNCPVWSFTTEGEKPQSPAHAHSPVPEDGATNVPINTHIGWTYTSEEGFSDPDGFLVNMWTGDLSEDPYQADIEGGAGEHLFEEHPFEFAYGENYYWQVIPFVIYNNEHIHAEDCLVWTFTTVEEMSIDEMDIHSVNALLGNYPNPFNPETKICFSLAEGARVTLVIYNSRGQVVRELLSSLYYSQGYHGIVWDGKDRYGRKTSSGVYLYSMETDRGFRDIKKMVLLK
ncbi:MAG: hypothetical protein K0B81_02235 [Candidatus Cloacimonetes bacterium]|nr:hypothetical protein [Candidatus Cloacimonadota bacterium]